MLRSLQKLLTRFNLSRQHWKQCLENFVELRWSKFDEVVYFDVSSSFIQKAETQNITPSFIDRGRVN